MNDSCEQTTCEKSTGAFHKPLLSMSDAGQPPTLAFGLSVWNTGNPSDTGLCQSAATVIDDVWKWHKSDCCWQTYDTKSKLEWWLNMRPSKPGRPRVFNWTKHYSCAVQITEKKHQWHQLDRKPADACTLMQQQEAVTQQKKKQQTEF